MSELQIPLILKQTVGTETTKVKAYFKELWLYNRLSVTNNKHIVRNLEVCEIGKGMQSNTTVSIKVYLTLQRGGI